MTCRNGICLQQMASLGINWDAEEYSVNFIAMSASSAAQLMPKFAIALQFILVPATFEALILTSCDMETGQFKLCNPFFTIRPSVQTNA